MSSETYWEKVAATRWGSYIAAIEKRSIRTGHELATRPAHALEIGCEGGRWSKMLSDLGWHMTCIDVDAKMLSVCQKRVPSANCLLVNPSATRFPFEDGSFSFLLCMEVAPVVQSEWLLAEAHRLLIEGGIFVCMFWNAFSLRGGAYRVRDALKGKAGHDYYDCSYPKWRKKLRSRFEVKHEEGFCWGPFSRASDSPLIPLFTCGERLLGLHKIITLSPWVVFVARKKPSE